MVVHFTMPAYVFAWGEAADHNISYLEVFQTDQGFCKALGLCNNARYCFLSSVRRGHKLPSYSPHLKSLLGYMSTPLITTHPWDCWHHPPPPPHHLSCCPYARPSSAICRLADDKE